MLSVLVEGNYLRATARICDVAFNTVLKFVPEIGKACAEYQNRAFHNLTCKRIQCDEIWSFCYAKEKNVPEDKEGSIWLRRYLDMGCDKTLIAKLVPSWLVGNGDADTELCFYGRFSSRFSHRVQLTTDGWKYILEAVDMVFREDIDYAILVKLYGEIKG